VDSTEKSFPAAPLDPGELVESSGAATWRENPYAESAEDAKGVLYLTTKRILFETAKVQPFVSFGLTDFEAVEVTTKQRGTRVLLLLTHIGGQRKSLWCDPDLARRVAAAIEPSTAPQRRAGETPRHSG
jgi:hypothetical protein